MIFRLLADATVLLHVAFVFFVVCGGLLLVRWPRVAWLHLPAAVWGAWVEFAGWICPLTLVENWLRRQDGGTAYPAGFIEHYVLPVLYPSSLSLPRQWVLGSLVLVLNLVVYAVVLRRRGHLARSRAAG